LQECEDIEGKCKDFCEKFSIHSCKELENFLLIPEAIDRAFSRRLSDLSRRQGGARKYSGNSREILNKFCAEKKNDIMAQKIAARKHFARSRGSHLNDATLNKEVIEEFEQNWKNEVSRFKLIPGKEALTYLNEAIQKEFKISIMPTSIIDVMNVNEIPEEVKGIIANLEEFCSLSI
jgi:hypothetical protein